MRSYQSLRMLRAICRRPAPPQRFPRVVTLPVSRCFHAACRLDKLQTHVLSDIGEGVKEVQIIQWFVQEGAAVEEWAPLCEVQSDKASVDITSKYTGVVKKLYFEQDAIVQVGDAMLDIDVENEDDQELGGAQEQDPASTDESPQGEHEAPEAQEDHEQQSGALEIETTRIESPAKLRGEKAGLASPAVRGLLREHGLEISEVDGTGREGRVLKEDVHKHLEGLSRDLESQASAVAAKKPGVDSKQVETSQTLTAVQSAMFKTMTKSLSIPHFLFSDTINVASLKAARGRINAIREAEALPKMSYLPFVVKAVSLGLYRYPILNARLETDQESKKPNLFLRSNHNIGVAMDTPSGLLVPVIKSVNAKSISSIAQELQHLSQLARSGKLSSSDLSGGTITVSNIGNIGGDVVAPVIVEGQLAILGLGKIKPTPVFAADGKTVERADLMSASWSADHRVIDGATMARMAKMVQDYLEQPETMMIDMC